MTLPGQEVAGVKADQRGCGAGSQDGTINLLRSQRKPSFFSLAIRIENTITIVTLWLPPECKGYNSELQTGLGGCWGRGGGGGAAGLRIFGSELRTAAHAGITEATQYLLEPFVNMASLPSAV